MLFGKPAPAEEIEPPELDAYLDGCLDGKLRRLYSRVSDTEAALDREHTYFVDSIKAFSESDPDPDMEYLYGIKESFVRSQKPSYSSSLLHIASVKPSYGGSNSYLKAESMLKSYNDFIIRVLSDNTKFRLVMMAYAARLKDTKAHFNAIERLCKELSLELSSSSVQLAEYREVSGKIKILFDLMSRISSIELQHGSVPEYEARQDSAEIELAEHVREKEGQLEEARSRYRDARAQLTGLLLPIERVARKHDHTSDSKRKLTDYISEPEARINTAEDAKVINDQLGLVIEQVRSGSMDVKSPDSLIAQLNSIRGTDLLGLAQSVRQHDAHFRKMEDEARALRAKLHESERSGEQKRRIIMQKGEMEGEIKRNRESVLSTKKEIEWLLHKHYKKQVLIKIGEL